VDPNLVWRQAGGEVLEEQQVAADAFEEQPNLVASVAHSGAALATI